VNVRAEGRQIGEELANEYGLTQEQRTTTFPDRPESVWSNRIRWTRMSLVQKGDLDGSRRGVWRVTEQGRRRVSESRV
jgi:restriction system protein